jgi:hypothetical protein
MNVMRGENYGQVYIHAVGIPYFAVTKITYCDWMRCMDTMGSHFNVIELT